jgi:hypothetical protein
VVGLFVVGLAFSDDPSPPADRAEADTTTTSTEPPSTTTTTRPATTTTTIPVGPVFGEPVGSALLSFSGGWTVVDLDTGARREIALPTDGDPWGAVPVAGGIVMASGGGAVYYNLLDGSDPTAEVELGRASQVLATGRPDRVWLISNGDTFGAVPSQTARVQLVDLRGEVLRSFVLPTPYGEGALDEGLLVTQGGRIFLADERGLRAISTGTLLSSVGPRAAVLTCDDRAICAIALVDAEGTSTTLIPRAPIGSWFSVWWDSDGARLSLQQTGPEGSTGELVIFSAAGEPLGSYEGSLTFSGVPRWLPGDLGLIVAGSSGPQWIHEIDGRWEAETPPSLEGLPSEALWVIQP